jgi:hypothetical protein
MLLVQTPLRQSVSPEQSLPAAHAEQTAPPQSTSVSSWFFTLSSQAAAWQVLGSPVHTPLMQSPAPLQVCPALHLGHEEPQSMSVSVPFFTPSEQLTG